MDKRFAPQKKLIASPKLTQYLAGEFVAPINVEMSLVGFCNARCPFCFYAAAVNPLPGWDKEKLTLDIVKELFIEFHDIDVQAVTYTGGGDSSLHPNIKEIIDFAYSLNIKQGMITNAIKKINYNPEYCEWIRISLTDRPLPIENLKVLRACKTVGININYLGNENEVKRMLEIAHDINLDYVEVRPALNLHGKTTNIEPPNIKDDKLIIIDYKFQEAKLPHGTHYNKCVGYHFVPFIWQDGDVDVCAYHRKNTKFNLGNIYKDSFKDIMLRAPRNVDVIPQCQVCCKNHEINILINSLEDLEDKEFV